MNLWFLLLNIMSLTLDLCNTARVQVAKSYFLLYRLISMYCLTAAENKDYRQVSCFLWKLGWRVNLCVNIGVLVNQKVLQFKENASSSSSIQTSISAIKSVLFCSRVSVTWTYTTWHLKALSAWLKGGHGKVAEFSVSDCANLMASLWKQFWTLWLGCRENPGNRLWRA